MNPFFYRCDYEKKREKKDNEPEENMVLYNSTNDNKNHRSHCRTTFIHMGKIIWKKQKQTNMDRLLLRKRSSVKLDIRIYVQPPTHPPIHTHKREYRKIEKHSNTVK